MNTATALTLKPEYEWRTIVRTVPVVLPRYSKRRSIKEKVMLAVYRVGQDEGCMGYVHVEELTWGRKMVKEVRVHMGGGSNYWNSSTIGINDDHIQEIHKLSARRPEGSYFEVIA
jgi:hypothetical protein